jgi:uncharacterized protein (DUF362 family)
MITRRGAFSGIAAAAGLGGCTARQGPPRRAQVRILRQPDYGPGVYQAVRDLVRTAGPLKGKRVLLKPNLVEFNTGKVINTNPVVVHAALEAFRAEGAADVRIAEGPGHRRQTSDMAEDAGYFHQIRGFDELFTDLNFDDVTLTKLGSSHTHFGSLHLPNTVLGADLLVSLPKMKTHHWAGVTLSMKNYFGLVPGSVYGWPKNVLHWAGIPESIVDLYNTFASRSFSIVDGIDAMEGAGPVDGTLRHAGVLVGGADLAAVDITCCRIMKIDPERIEYLNYPGVPNVTIEQTGETIAGVQTEFALVDKFKQYRLRS